jgi:antimicrobial peptide system SdpA family protein
MNKTSKPSLIAFYSSVSIVLVIFFTILSIYFGNNPLNNSYTAKSKFISAFPQGWAFFTKSAKEPEFYIFECFNGKIEMKNLRNFSNDYYYGLSRHNRILAIEASTILNKIKSDSITGYRLTAKIAENITEKINLDTLKFNKISVFKKNVPDFKGKYLFVSKHALPWSLLNQKPDYPSSFIVYAINIHQDE